MTATDDAPVPEWLTRKQYAALMQVHPQTVSRWIGADPSMRIQRLGPSGFSVRIHRSELDRRPASTPVDTEAAKT